MPALGMAQATGRLVAWLRPEGASVAAGDPLMEVETDKTRVEIEAPASGVIAGVLVGPDEEVPVGARLAWILAPGEAVPAAGSPVGASVGAHAGGPASAAGEAAATLPGPAPAAGASGPGRGSGARVAASPRARRLAAERGVDLARLEGSGPDGARVAADLARGAGAGPEISPLRRRMAEHTARVWATTPHFFLARDVRARRLVEWQTALRRRTGLPVTVTDLLLRTCAAALRSHPALRDHWEAGRVRRNRDGHLGLAVATHRGLLVVVVRDAGDLDLAQLVAARQTVIERARSGRLHAQDLEGAAFTVSNLGPQGVDRFGAVLPERQSAILAVGRVRETVVAVAGQPRVEPTLSLTLSCDHRVLDGAQGAAFLAEVVELLEEPALLLEPGHAALDHP
ncbi:MAG TPA: dihydrolipoamide acetyltransferase family protein [Candidatus Micrarchaeia archaeon]|nr:dihydrolipoamide acetyltransferase family protein [Candidatus Micrarchaeia archaeon]